MTAADLHAALIALIVEMQQEADLIDGDGDYCCAQTTRGWVDQIDGLVRRLGETDGKSLNDSANVVSRVQPDAPRVVEMSEGEAGDLRRRLGALIAQAQQEIERGLNVIDKEVFIVNYDVIKRGAGGLASCVERSTAMHALLFPRLTLKHAADLLSGPPEQP